MLDSYLQKGPHELIPSSLEIFLHDFFVEAVDEAGEVDELVEQEKDQLGRRVPPQQVR